MIVLCGSERDVLPDGIGHSQVVKMEHHFPEQDEIELTDGPPITMETALVKQPAGETPPLETSAVSAQEGQRWTPEVRFFILIAATIVAVWVLFTFTPLLQALGIGALLAILLNPAVNGLMRRLNLNRGAAASVVFVLFLLILFSAAAALGSLAVTQMLDLSSDLAGARAELELWLLQPIDLLGFHLEPEVFWQSFQANLDETIGTMPLDSLNLLSSVTTNMLWALTIFVTLYYFLKNGPEIVPWIRHRIPAGHLEEFDGLVDEVEDIWTKFLRIQLLLFVVLIFLMALGTLGVVWLFRSGLIRWSLLGFGLLLLLVYTAVQQVDNLWLRPQFMGRHLRLHPAVVFVGLIAGLAYGGILGAILVVPAIATARVIGRYVYRKMMGIELWPEM